MSELTICRLHDRWDLLEECCELLNNQWSMSVTARHHLLKRSTDMLPCSLLLLQNEKVIGHARVSKHMPVSNSCLITSLIVSPECRGKGYGKYLMQKTEEYARLLGYEKAFLSTEDKREFYEHLGYKYYLPGLLLTESAKTIFQKPDTKMEKTSCDIVASTPSSNIPIPPQLPSNLFSTTPSQNVFYKRKIWMKKKLLKTEKT